MQFLKFFITFFKIGAFTFGGGYAMIPLIQAEVVEKNKWLSNDEFLDTIAISQSLPGAIAVNSSLFIGYRLGGVLGSIVCGIGVVLPSFIIILMISIYFYKLRNNKMVDKVFLGIRPAVVALISSAVYKLSKASKIEGKALIIPIISLTAVMLNVSPIIVILTGGLFSILYFKYLEEKEKKVG